MTRRATYFSVLQDINHIMISCYVSRFEVGPVTVNVLFTSVLKMAKLFISGKRTIAYFINKTLPFYIFSNLYSIIYKYIVYENWSEKIFLQQTKPVNFVSHPTTDKTNFQRWKKSFRLQVFVFLLGFVTILLDTACFRVH